MNRIWILAPEYFVADLITNKISYKRSTYRQIPKLRTLVLNFGIFGNDVKC